MGFENKFVVDLFVKLAPFVDRSANNHVLTDQPQETASIPDLCLKLFGVRDMLRIEAKWVSQPQATNVTVTRKQVRSWQEPPTPGNLTPHLWVARRRTAGSYFLVPWQSMSTVLAAADDEIGPPVPKEPTSCKVALPSVATNEAVFWSAFWSFVAGGTLGIEG